MLYVHHQLSGPVPSDPTGQMANVNGDMCMGRSNNPPRMCSPEVMIGLGPPGRVPARVDSQAIRTALGRDSLMVQFDQGGWVQIGSVGPHTEILVSGPCCPLMALYSHPTSGGRVAFTTFHNEAQASSDVQSILRALIFQL